MEGREKKPPSNRCTEWCAGAAGSYYLWLSCHPWPTFAQVCWCMRCFCAAQSPLHSAGYSHVLSHILSSVLEKPSCTLRPMTARTSFNWRTCPRNLRPLKKQQQQQNITWMMDRFLWEKHIHREREREKERERERAFSYLNRQCTCISFGDWRLPGWPTRPLHAQCGVLLVPHVLSSVLGSFYCCSIRRFPWPDGYRAQSVVLCCCVQCLCCRRSPQASPGLPGKPLGSLNLATCRIVCKLTGLRLN